jgi:hypothetical protein
MSEDFWRGWRRNLPTASHDERIRSNLPDSTGAVIPRSSMKANLAQTLKEEFADATGVSGKAEPRRYLRTDAFAVCNLLGLARRTGDDRYLRFARELVDQVHHVLGRHRDDDPRQGWISGLPAFLTLWAPQTLGMRRQFNSCELPRIGWRSPKATGFNRPERFFRSYAWRQIVV